MNKLKVRAIEKACYIWQKTDISPELEVEENNSIICIFPKTEKVVQAVNDFLQGAPSPNAFDFFQRYRLLRNRIYSMRDSLGVGIRRGGANE